MKIEYYRQEVKRLEVLLQKLRRQQDASHYEKLKSVVCCLSRNEEQFPMDECDCILNNIENYIVAGTSDSWIVMSILFDYYRYDDGEIKDAIWHYEEGIGNEPPDCCQVRMVKEDDDLLGENTDWNEVLKLSWLCVDDIIKDYYDKLD